MKYRYYKLAKDVERPIIPLEISNGDTKVRYFGLIDSGADINIFHSEIAEILGIDLEKGIKGSVSGITHGESQSYYIHPINLSIGGWKYETVAAFMPTLSKNGHGLLGQAGFFDLFRKVAFNFNKKEIELVQKE